MFYATLLMVVTLCDRSYESKQEPTIPVDSPSTFEIKEEDFKLYANISCNSAPLDVPPASLAGRWSEAIFVMMYGCSPPASPDPPALPQVLAARGVRPLQIKAMALRDVPPDARFNASHFEGFDSLLRLQVQAASEDHPQQLDGNFLQSLPRLKRLFVKNQALPPLEKNVIVYVRLKNGRSLGAWGDCNTLRTMELWNWRVATGVTQTRGWLSECMRLNCLRMEHMEPDSLQTVLSGIGSVRKLYLQNNALTQPDLLVTMKETVKNIEYLYVMNNNLTYIDNVLESQKKLQLLDLSHNMVDDFVRTVRAIFSLPKLRNSLKSLILDHNSLRDYNCNSTDNPWLFYNGDTRLHFMSLVATNTSRVCFTGWKLGHLNLSMNNIKELQFGQLPLFSDLNSLVVDLRHNPLRELRFEESNYNALNNIFVPGKRVIVHADPLPMFDCDCNNGWLARALRENRVLITTETLCRDGTELRAMPPAKLECDLQLCIPCTCRRLWKPPTVIMQCDALRLREMPYLPNLGELYLKGNHINTLRAKHLPTTLTLVDLRDNNISRVDKVTSEALFAVSERRMWLAGNPIICDCDNWPLLGALQAHSIQVEDYENVTCADERLLRDVSQEQLCTAIAWGWVGAGGVVLIALVGLLGALYVRYEWQLKVWLFARGWCLSCLREEELDADRHYDVFVSFAHGDHEFVTSQLLPGLEEGPHGYKVCVHYRDWMPGELIPTQIVRSVASSRRTLIVLSANFVQSMWGIMEFRAAYLSALAEGRVRLVVVVLDDAPPTEELPEELRLYMSSTTYLGWDDPWFWQKLRYALPHRKAQETRNDPCEEPVREGMPAVIALEMMLYE